MHKPKPKPRFSVTLPNGRALTRGDLPPADTRRWVASRKARVVMAVESGLLDIDEAVQIYELSHEEYKSWVDAVKSNGISGLKATQLQKFREM